MNTETKNPSASSSVNPVPNGMRTVTPHLVCAGAADAIEFYKKAFGATENMRLAAPDGKLMHGCVSIGDSMVMLVDEMPDCGCMGPKSIGGSPVTIHLQVEDADALHDRAVKAGATATMPMADMFWGDRYGIVTDPFGHNWSIATHIKDLTPEEIQEAAKNACCGQ
ncbi:MAG: VOC family protein [Verrucomicrobiaceae bacterium]|nr:MAG: VOC family protein [Verrucomicrobiaceae bacterium]